MSDTGSEGTQADNWLLTSLKHHTLSSQIIQDVESRNTSGDRCVHCCFVQHSSLVEYLGHTAKVKAASSKKEAKRVEERVVE